MRITREQAKDLKHRFKQILEFAPDLDGHGICYHLYYVMYRKHNVKSGIIFDGVDICDGFDIYDVMRVLMDDSKGYIGSLCYNNGGYNDDRISFLMLFSTMSSVDLQSVINAGFEAFAPNGFFTL